MLSIESVMPTALLPPASDARPRTLGKLANHGNANFLFQVAAHIDALGQIVPSGDAHHGCNEHREPTPI